jgi:hypothetical protein
MAIMSAQPPSNNDDTCIGLLAKDENGQDESRFVRNRIPFFPVRFRFFWDKQKRDRKQDGVNRERDQKW